MSTRAILLLIALLVVWLHVTVAYLLTHPLSTSVPPIAEKTSNTWHPARKVRCGSLGVDFASGTAVTVPASGRCVSVQTLRALSLLVARAGQFPGHV
jgi:hypothetical protein